MMPQIAIVLVSPQGDANIGAAARAMGNFGITDLRLVNAVPHRTAEAYKWAVGARDILDGAGLFRNVSDALKEMSCAVAFTRRLGRSRRHLTMGEAAPWIARRSSSGKVALLFGREDKGLSTAEVRCCDVIVSIPTSGALPSLNLAQAVLIACYEVHRQLAGHLKTRRPGMPGERPMTRAEMGPILDQLDDMLDGLSYSDTAKNPLRSKIRTRFERLFGRGGLTTRDSKMFEGLIKRINSRNRL